MNSKDSTKKINRALFQIVRKSFACLLLLFVCVSCGADYQHLQPCSVTARKVTFKGIEDNEISIPFVYSVPEKYTPNKPWPLVVALHGYGSNAAAFHDLWKSVTDSLGYVLLTPQGENITEAGFGWSWGANAEQSVFICMDIIRKAVHVDPRRVYLAGFSAGGRLTYSIGCKHPHVFRGIAPLGAPFNENVIPVNSPQLKDMRVYIAHGALETRISSDA